MTSFANRARQRENRERDWSGELESTEQVWLDRESRAVYATSLAECYQNLNHGIAFSPSFSAKGPGFFTILLRFVIVLVAVGVVLYLGLKK